MLSVYVVCWIFLQTFQTYFCIQANSVTSDQTAPRGAVWAGSTRLQKWLLKSQADDKADDNCCDWQFDLGPRCLQKWLLKSQADDKVDNNCCYCQFKG